jgi:hypothetical protein
MMQPTDHSSSDRCHPEALTSIHSTYTLAATDKTESNEMDNVIIRHFIETVAEISLSIASRKQGSR